MVQSGPQGRCFVQFLVPGGLQCLAQSKDKAVVQEARVPLNEYEFPAAKISNIQSQLERLVGKNYYLNQSARDAYRGYLLSYNSHQLKSIFNVHTLDLQAVSQSLGFAGPPKVHCSSVPPVLYRALESMPNYLRPRI